MEVLLVNYNQEFDYSLQLAQKLIIRTTLFSKDMKNTNVFICAVVIESVLHINMTWMKIT